MKSLIKSLQDLFSSDNEFFVMARTGKRITHIAIAIPIVIVFIIVAQIISVIPGQLLVNNFDLSDVLIEFYNLFISFGLVIFVVWIWVRFFEKRLFRSIGFVKKGALKFYLKGFFIGLIMLAIVVTLMRIVGVVSFTKSPEPINLNMIGVIILMLVGYMVQGAGEEVLARGWQFQIIGARYKPWLGAVISSIIFALLHGMNTGVSLLAVINLILFAFLLTFLILYDKNIWAACGWHTSWNWAMENIYGLKVSGTEGLGSVLDSSINGPNYLTGGDFGPEGSIFTTMVLIGGMIIILIRNSKK